MQWEEKKKEWKKSEENLHDLWDILKWISIHMMKILEGAKYEKGVESLFKEIITENFPNLARVMNEHPDPWWPKNNK